MDQAGGQGRSDEPFGERVRRLRTARGWTQEQLAKAAGISKSVVSETETGVTRPRGANLVKIAKALEASLDYLMTGDVPPPAPAPTSVHVPAELVAVAREEGLQYAHVEALMGFANQLIAMRRNRGEQRLTEVEWRDLYARVRPMLESFGGGKAK